MAGDVAQLFGKLIARRAGSQSAGLNQPVDQPAAPKNAGVEQESPQPPAPAAPFAAAQCRRRQADDRRDQPGEEN